ncbi:MAG: ctaA [Rhodospirillales bacterium]|nr:ctaA [Rhodospirillales bacterium]
MSLFPQSVDPARRRTVGLWLLCLLGMVFGAVVLGGFTRLTGSGLSMADWRPVTGWLPPLSDTEWQRMFDLYRATPQFHHVNYDMTVETFRSIFWLEYVHRLWGRLMGLVFLVPFLWFVLRGFIERPLIPRIGLLFVLGGLQGVIGWFMVASGLVDHPEVSQYRLVAHLGAAMLIFVYMLWLALTLLSGEARARPVIEPLRPLARWTQFAIGWVAVTMLAGGFVAGLDAGFTYNTFPLMDGRWIPDGSFGHWLAPFEDIPTVQFNHRLMAIIAVILITILWVKARRTLSAGFQLTLYHGVLLAVLAQAALGITTLLMAVPTPLGAAHQALAFVLLGVSVWARYGLSRVG